MAAKDTKAEAPEAPKAEPKEKLVELVSRARKPQVFNVRGQDAIHLMPGTKSRHIKEELVNYEMRAAEKRKDILIHKL